MADIPDDSPIIPQGVTLRAFDDTKAARQGIYDGTLAALKTRFPLENKTYRLELSNVRYTGPQDFTLAQQKKALLGDQNLHTPVSGHFRLIRKADNAVVDEKDEVVMNVPYYTDRGTIINNGSEYTVANQLRLRPGVYTRVRRSGDVETQFNVKPGTGRGFRLRMEPSTGVVTVNVGHANMPLYPLLKTLGVTDKEMIKAWGTEVAHANAAKADSVAGRSAIDKLYQAFAGYNATAQDLVSKETYLRDTLPKFVLDPGVTSRTLGITAEGITPQVLLRAAAKMFNVNRGEEEADDRDNPGFANVFGIDDLYRERIEKDAGKLGRTLMMKISRAGSLKPVQRGAFSGWHHELLQGSGLAMPGDNSNPMALEEQMLRVTRMGEGGIGSADVVTDEARQVNSGNLNFIDPVSGPENERIGVDARLGVHTRKGSDGKLYSLFLNRQGKKEYVACDTASDSVIGFPNPGTDETHVPAMKHGRVQMVPRDEVDYFMPDLAGMFSSNINLNPMPTAVQGGRQFYGSKFWDQYLPAANGEVPLVDSLMPDGKMTWSEHYGRKLGTLRSPVEGTVTKVTDKGVTVTDAEGQKHFVETVTDFPFNGLTGLTYTPTVKAGDAVKVDDMVAASNFVDKKTGGLAMGVNLKMAWLPYKGFSYEDAIVLSASAAKKIASNRLYGFEADPRDGSELGLAKYMSAFPQKFTKEQYATLDDNGVVKPGTVLNKGDPISVAVGPKLLTAEDANLGKLSKVLRGAFTDKAQTWEHDYPGTVVESGIFRGRAKINVQAAPPLGFGDKMSPRYALKGVIGRVVDDDRMPRDAVTNEPYDILMNPLGIPSRVAPGQLIETALGKLAKATGQPIRLPQDAPPEGWAQWASDQLAAAGVSPTTDVFDPETGRTLKGIGDGYVYFHGMHHLADKKISAKGGAGGYTADLQPAKGGHTGAKRMCFVAAQPIRVLHGEESIGHIVEKKIPAYVWTRNQDGTWGYALVTNWFCRKGKVSEVISITVTGLPGSDNCNRKRVVYTDKTLNVTRQHHVFSPTRGEILAGDVRPGEWLTSYGYVPTDDQMSLLIGSMMGDAEICNVNDNIRKQENGCCKNTPYFSEQHSHHQDMYVRWKYSKLGSLVSSRGFTQKKSKAGFSYVPGTDVYYYEIHRHDITESLKNMFYRQADGTLGKKNIWNVDLDSLGDVGIVAWFIDDGCITDHVKNGVPTGSPTGTISTNGFTEAENNKLATWLTRRLGAQVTVRHSASTYKGERRHFTFLGLSADACRVMARLVARYMRVDDIPPSKKWLRNEVSRLDDEYVGVNTACRLGSIPVLVTDVSPYIDSKHGPDDEICLYDITVGGAHKYCASDCLVSNSGLDVNALIAHGATENMKDFVTIRGTKNEDYWKSVRSGGPLPEPQVPFIYQKALNLLRAGGINVVEGQRATDILPMTDADTEKLTGGRVIQNSKMLDADLKELKGGLFDPYLTGGNANRDRWAAIQLPEPVPNPVMEEPVRRILGLTGKKLQAILSGEETLNGLTGGKALQAALAAIDVDAEIAKQRELVRKTRGSARDNAVKTLGYLAGCQKQGVTPKDWMVTKIPVIPPMFRPVAKIGDTALISDLNELYRDVIESADAFTQLKKDVPDAGLTEERLNVYKAVKAAYGLGEAISPEGQAKRLKGAIRQVIGTSPKLGTFQSKVISKAVDGVGRAVISPEPNYDMDQCGIPEDTAWTLYKDYVIRGLVRRGYPQERATQLVTDKAPVAKDLLLEEMGRRPVILDRAPTWHKFNFMAFWPTLVEGNTMRMNPLVEKAFTADHDGDQIIGKIVISCNLSKWISKKSPVRCKKFVEKLLKCAVRDDILTRMNIKKELPVLCPASGNESIVVLDFEDIPVGALDRTTQGINGPIEWYKPALPMKVAAFDDKTGRTVWASVEWVTRHPQRVVEVVTLNYGNQIITDDDPRAVYGIDPRSETMELSRFTPSAALDAGVVVPVVKNTLRLVCADSSTCMEEDDGLKLNADVGYLLGALAGDGWWEKKDHQALVRLCGHSRQIHIADLHGDVARRVESVLRKLYGDVAVSVHEYFKDYCPDRYGDTVRYSYSFTGVEALTEKLTSLLGGVGDENTSGSANKRLPQYLLNTSPEFRAAMLCGLFDTDGTVSLTKGGSRKIPQLSLQFTSTSLRLCRDVQLLSESLGIRATLIFNKVTIRGNDSWMVVLSAKDAKTVGVFSGLADTGKRDRFTTAVVDLEHVNSAFDNVVMPRIVADTILPWIPTDIPEGRTDYQRVWQAKKTGTLSRYLVPRIMARLESVWASRRTAIADAVSLLADKAARRDYTVTKEDIEVVRKGIRLLAHKSGDRSVYKDGLKIYGSTVRAAASGMIVPATLEHLYTFLKSGDIGPCVTQYAAVTEWVDRFVKNTDIGWDRVVKVEKTGKREDGYDLNVPGYETYMSVDGTILSNTMNFHVPASDKAVAEAAEKMLPSKNLFSTTDLRSPRYVPMMEMTLGLAKLTAPASQKPPQVFVTKQDVIRAYRRGEIGANDPVSILRSI